ncbi:MAG: hypothetical protein EOR26_09610 [Mesorhizobium sp.]|uniref:hypothetical protein n=2 Tax=Mesorhizobium TaxID=68287 RepID=UPI000FE8587C|nr:hypothetical protein [Mesorhizobium sp.]RWF92954.1 MAG: hypothetical protein EOQ45_19300 [Mesorhizobium sp.]RWI49730.1 MAG: hypothetical protein EOR15_11950 [Mesorhizobium sp.]RWJ31591.1 MAG: hypothetical protein EOR26_09610 [Mesorhizobium sp.]RWJ36546.1 MAG: hypothetical protein EOR27_00330 [Mesorhizobium sp.]RWJ46152.1 MAG: hypothetical protein EOR29_13035 [Mesorhizobium sp.]
MLLAKLELHHDHMRDLVWPRAGELLGHDWRDRIPGTGEMLGLVRDLVSRFSEALVCSECNAADAKAKREVAGIDDRFTFTVSEIRSFAIARPGRDHEIDIERARTIWEIQRGGFEMRLRLLDMLISEIGTGGLAHDKAGWPGVIPMQLAMGGQEMLWRAFLDQVREDERRGELSGLRREFLTRSVSLDSRRLADRTVKPSCGPTDEEYAAYSDAVSPKTWAATGDDWTCACCGRRKREVVRRASKGKWSGGIRKLRILVEETDADAIATRMRLFPGYRHELWVGDSYFVDVCSDCADVRRDARQRDRSTPDSHLKLEDIRDALQEVRANAAHVADQALVCERLRKNAPYDSAYEAYSAFRSLVSTLKARMDFRMSRGVPREAVIAELCEDLKYKHSIISDQDQLTLVEWLLARKVRDPREG